MSAEASFVEGGVKVRDGAGGATVGFVWIERAPGQNGLLGGQLQRWVLTNLLAPSSLSRFVFEPWLEAPDSLAEWIAAVQEPVRAGAEWGTNPMDDGLWPARKGAFYVVAESRVVQSISGALLASPETYPRRAIVRDLLSRRRQPRRPEVAAPGRDRAPGVIAPRGPGHAGPQVKRPLSAPPDPSDPTAQTVVPFLEIRQWEADKQDLLLDVGFGGGASEEPGGKMFFEGQELFLLRSMYRRAGLAGRGTHWQEKADAVKNLDQLRQKIVAESSEGTRFEETFCSYYQDIDPEKITPPPAEFL